MTVAYCTFPTKGLSRVLHVGEQNKYLRDLTHNGRVTNSDLGKHLREITIFAASTNISELFCGTVMLTQGS